MGENALEVGERDLAVDEKSFHLMEHRRVDHVGVAPVDLSRRHDANRRSVPLHDANLDG